MGGVATGLQSFFKGPSMPIVDTRVPPPPDLSEEAIRNAKLMERRRQLGLQGRGSTWLTGARGDTTPPSVGIKTLLGS